MGDNLKKLKDSFVRLLADLSLIIPKDRLDGLQELFKIYSNVVENTYNENACLEINKFKNQLSDKLSDELKLNLNLHNIIDRQKIGAISHNKGIRRLKAKNDHFKILINKYRDFIDCSNLEDKWYNYLAWLEHKENKDKLLIGPPA